MNPNQHVEIPKPVPPTEETIVAEQAQAQPVVTTEVTPTEVQSSVSSTPEVIQTVPVAQTEPVSEDTKAPELSEEKKATIIDEVMKTDLTNQNAADLASRVSDIETD